MNVVLFNRVDIESIAEQLMGSVKISIENRKILARLSYGEN